MPATGNGQSELPTQQARITGKRFSSVGVVPIELAHGHVCVCVWGVLIGLNEEEGSTLDVGGTFSYPVSVQADSFVDLKPGSSGFQNGPKTSSSPGISWALGARLRLLKQPVLLTEQLLSCLPLLCGTAIIGPFNQIMEAITFLLNIYFVCSFPLENSN